MTYDPRYQKKWKLDRHRGADRSLVPADVVRNHIAWLDGCMLSLRAIGDTAGVSVSAVSHILRGDHSGVQRDVAARILAVTPRAVYDRPNAAGFVPKVGAARRIQALYAIGWTGDHVNDAAGKPARFAQNLLNQKGVWVTLDAWRAVVRAYDELGMTPGPSTVNRRRAQKYGWAPPLAWDEASLDDPGALPETDEAADITAAGWGRVNPDSLHDCAIEWGMTRDQAADRLGVTRDAIDAALSRNDDGTFATAFARNATAQGHDRPTRDGLGLRRTA